MNLPRAVEFNNLSIKKLASGLGNGETSSAEDSDNLGQGTFYIWGTFNGATATLEASPNGGSDWFQVAQFTSKGMTNLDLRYDQLRVNMDSSGDNSTSIDAGVV